MIPNGTPMVSTPCASIALQSASGNLTQGIWSASSTPTMMVGSSNGGIQPRILDSSTPGIITFPSGQTMFMSSMASSAPGSLPTGVASISNIGNSSLQIPAHIAIPGRGTAHSPGTLLMATTSGNPMVVSCSNTNVSLPTMVPQIPNAQSTFIQGPNGPISVALTSTNMQFPASLASSTINFTSERRNHTTPTTSMVYSTQYPKPVESSSNIFPTTPFSTMHVTPGYQTLLPGFTAHSDQAMLSSAHGQYPSSSATLLTSGTVVGSSVPAKFGNLTLARQPLLFPGDGQTHSSSVTFHGDDQVRNNQLAPSVTLQNSQSSCETTLASNSVPTLPVLLPVSSVAPAGSAAIASAGVTTHSTNVLPATSVPPYTTQVTAIPDNPPSFVPADGINQSVVGEPSLPPYKAESLNQILADLDPKLHLDSESELLLTNLTSEFIIEIAQKAGKLAKHRDSQIVDAKDIQFYLDRDWSIYVPGGAPDGRIIKDTLQLQAHKQRMAIIKKNINKM